MELSKISPTSINSTDSVINRFLIAYNSKASSAQDPVRCFEPDSSKPYANEESKSDLKQLSDSIFLTREEKPPNSANNSASFSLLPSNQHSHKFKTLFSKFQTINRQFKQKAEKLKLQEPVKQNKYLLNSHSSHMLCPQQFLTRQMSKYKFSLDWSQEQASKNQAEYQQVDQEGDKPQGCEYFRNTERIDQEEIESRQAPKFPIDYAIIRQKYENLKLKSERLQKKEQQWQKSISVSDKKYKRQVQFLRGKVQCLETQNDGFIQRIQALEDRVKKTQEAQMKGDKNQKRPYRMQRSFNNQKGMEDNQKSVDERPWMDMKKNKQTALQFCQRRIEKEFGSQNTQYLKTKVILLSQQNGTLERKVEQLNKYIHSLSATKRLTTSQTPNYKDLYEKLASNADTSRAAGKHQRVPDSLIRTKSFLQRNQPKNSYLYYYPKPEEDNNITLSNSASQLRIQIPSERSAFIPSQPIQDTNFQNNRRIERSHSGINFGNSNYLLHRGPPPQNQTKKINETQPPRMYKENTTYFDLSRTPQRSSWNPRRVENNQNERWSARLRAPKIETTVSTTIRYQ